MALSSFSICVVYSIQMAFSSLFSIQGIHHMPNMVHISSGFMQLNLQTHLTILLYYSDERKYQLICPLTKVQGKHWKEHFLKDN